MAQFFHPARADITLIGVLNALGDPIRFQIVERLYRQQDGLSCSAAIPKGIAPSTLSHHFRVLRESGLVHTTKVGVENRNLLRIEDIEARFPGLIDQIIRSAGPRDLNSGTS